jgi:hypothetical protein
LLIPADEVIFSIQTNANKSVIDKTADRRGWIGNAVWIRSQIERGIFAYALDPLIFRHIGDRLSGDERKSYVSQLSEKQTNKIRRHAKQYTLEMTGNWFITMTSGRN